MNTEIRLPSNDDFDQVGKIFTEENQFHVELVPEIIQIANPIMMHVWFEKVLINPDKTLFAATIKDNLVGVALVEHRTNIDDPIFRSRIISISARSRLLNLIEDRGLGAYR